MTVKGQRVTPYFFIRSMISPQRKFAKWADSAKAVQLFCTAVPTGLERGFQTQKLTAEDLLVVAFLKIFLEKPAARAADGDIIVDIAVIVQERYVIVAVLRAELGHLLDRVPPQIVVALEQVFCRGVRADNQSQPWTGRS